MIGTVYPIASIAAQSITVTSLGLGTGASNTKWKNKFMLRAEAANAADRVRICSSFNGNTGVLTHTGTAYIDQTATSEFVELVEFDPNTIDTVISQMLGNTRRKDVSVLPTRQGTDHYFIGDLNWINEPADIKKIVYSPNPVISRDRYLSKWNTVTTAGVLQLDNFAISSGSYVRDTVNVRRSQYSAQITRAGTNLTFGQSPGLLVSDASLDSLSTRVVTAVAWVLSSVASQCRVQVNDGVTTTSSSYHTGNGTWQELTVQATIGATATNVTANLSVEGSNTPCNVDELYLTFGPINDTIRRDYWPTYALQPYEYRYQQGSGELTLLAGPYGVGQRLEIHSERPYPEFDSTRIASGLADSDLTDCPLNLIAYGAISLLYDSLANQQNVDTARFHAIAADAWNDYERLALAHISTDDEKEGAPIGMRMLAPSARRY